MSSRFTLAFSAVFLGLAVSFWLVPFFWTGWKGRAWTGLPKAVTFQHSAAGLFTRRTPKWWDQHLEAQGVDHRRFEISERAVFGMGAFGFRTRFDRILIESNRSRVSRQVRRRLAEHVLLRLEDGGDPEAGWPVKSLQLVRSLWTVGDEALANPAGEWNPPPVTAVTGANRQVLGTYQLVAGKIAEMQTPRTLEVPLTARLRTDPNAGGGANPAAGANRVPQKRPLVVPAPRPGSAPGVPLPWRNHPPQRPLRPGEPATKAPNPVRSNEPPLTNGARGTSEPGK